MGREIRKVPKNWQHPKDDNGNYIPMHDQSFDEALKEWQDGLAKWIAGEDPDADKFDYPKTEPGYSEWHGASPDPESYRKETWTEAEANCFQVYETVSEGTPTSPVFESLEALENWLVEQGHSRTAAANFCEGGWATSMIFNLGTGEMKQGIDACE